MTDVYKRTPAGKPRARFYAIPFDGTPGPLNSITDVDGLSVGYTTLISGDGKLIVGNGPVRTGITAILPRRRAELAVPLFAGFCSFNGNGEMSGTHLIEETGRFNFPITITNTHSCGMSRDATLKWMQRVLPESLDDAFGLPVAAETSDSYMNDMNGHHVTDEHVFAALEAATRGAIEEGSVGGGTGMRCFGLKGGSGTASRLVEWQGKTYTVGVFVQSNYGDRRYFTLRGRQAGFELLSVGAKASLAPNEKSSVIGIAATDAPFLPHQMKRLARRMPLGIGLTGGVGHHGSGDIFLAFTTANAIAAGTREGSLATADFIPDQDLNDFFHAIIEATEEAVLNSMIANEDMTGRDGHFTPALPKDWLEATYGEA
jgi:D-aminopeptidase